MMLPLSNDILVRDCWHCPQRRDGPARVSAKSRATAICRALVKLPNSERLDVSFMAFSSGLLLTLLLPRVRPTLQPNQELSNAQRGVIPVRAGLLRGFLSSGVNRYVFVIMSRTT